MIVRRSRYQLTQRWRLPGCSPISSGPVCGKNGEAFWLGLVERWQALESQKAQQALRDKSRTPRRRQSVLASAD